MVPDNEREEGAVKAGDLVVLRPGIGMSGLYSKPARDMYSETGQMWSGQVALVLSHELSSGVTRVLTQSGTGLIADQYLRVVHVG